MGHDGGFHSSNLTVLGKPAATRGFALWRGPADRDAGDDSERTHRVPVSLRRERVLAHRLIRRLSAGCRRIGSGLPAAAHLSDR